MFDVAKQNVSGSAWNTYLDQMLQTVPGSQEENVESPVTMAIVAKPQKPRTSAPSFGPISDPISDPEDLLAAYNPQIGAALDAIVLNDLEAFKEAMLTMHPGETVFANGAAAVYAREQLNLSSDAPAMTLASLIR